MSDVGKAVMTGYEAMIADAKTRVKDPLTGKWNGHLADPGEWRCKVCSKPLNPNGDRPAETYAGTFTGMCYDCEGAKGFVVKTYRDGAQLWSYPPHCPAWRRDREEFTGYADCAACRGSGRSYVSRHDAMGGSYYVHCPKCLDRYVNEPLRKEYADRLYALSAKANEVFQKRLNRKAMELGFKQRGKKEPRTFLDTFEGGKHEYVLAPIYERTKAEFDQRLAVLRQWAADNKVDA